MKVKHETQGVCCEDKQHGFPGEDLDSSNDLSPNEGQIPQKIQPNAQPVETN